MPWWLALSRSSNRNVLSMQILNCVLGARRWVFLSPHHFISYSLGLFKGKFRKKSWKSITTIKSARIAFFILKCYHFFGCGKGDTVCFTAKENFWVMCTACNFRCFLLLVWVSRLGIINWNGLEIENLFYTAVFRHVFNCSHCFETKKFKKSTPWMHSCLFWKDSCL